jgi:hypothetical protein
MAATLTDTDRARLATLAGMLQSAHDGEVVAAARKCTAFLQGRRLSWTDVLTAQATAPPVVAQARTWRSVAEELVLNHYATLLPREPDYLTGLLQCGLTPTQAAWLAKIARRAGVPAWESTP